MFQRVIRCRARRGSAPSPQGLLRVRSGFAGGRVTAPGQAGLALRQPGGLASGHGWSTASRSISARISLEAGRPPPSRGMFRVRPQAWRLTLSAGGAGWPVGRPPAPRQGPARARPRPGLQLRPGQRSAAAPRSTRRGRAAATGRLAQNAPLTPGHADMAVPKDRAVWRRASSVASSRLITKVPGWLAVQRCPVAGLAKCST